MRSGSFSKSSGAWSFIVASRDSAYAGGTPYHVLGSPLEREREGVGRGRKRRRGRKGRRGRRRGRRGRKEGEGGRETVNIILHNTHSFFLPSPVQVVDGVAPVVFNVPAETGEAHAHIQPWNLWERHTQTIASTHVESRV